jgi:hypothetical protein
MGRNFRRSPPDALQRADPALFRRVAQIELPVLGWLLRPLSNAAPAPSDAATGAVPVGLPAAARWR